MALGHDEDVRRDGDVRRGGGAGLPAHQVMIDRIDHLDAGESGRHVQGADLLRDLQDLQAVVAAPSPGSLYVEVGAVAQPRPVVRVGFHVVHSGDGVSRSEEHTSELQSLMRTSYAVFCLKKKKQT